MITKYNNPDLQNLLSLIPAITGRTITGKANLFYWGAIAGSEFLTYAATKIYLCRQMQFGQNTVPGIVNDAGITLYNQADAAIGQYSGRILYFHTGATAVHYLYNSFVLENILFSRLVTSQYANMIFRGMVITLSP